MDNTALLIKKWDEIIKKHILCSCGEVYTSREMAAPDCPYHAQDWETPMVEFLKELAAQSSPIEAKSEVSEGEIEHPASFFGRMNLEMKDILKEFKKVNEEAAPIEDKTQVVKETAEQIMFKKHFHFEDSLEMVVSFEDAVKGAKAYANQFK